MTKTLEFFYDCSSPWPYFAFTCIQPIAAAAGVAIDWRPILVGGVFNAVNQQVYSTRESLFSDAANARKLDYFSKDLADWARLCGVTLNWPEGHPINSVKAMRGALYAQDMGLEVPYATAVFETYWGSDTPDISDDAVLGSICDRVGLSRDDFLAAIRDPAYKDRLRANTDELIDRGGFGSPTLFIDREDMYFGNDRLPLVEARLRR